MVDTPPITTSITYNEYLSVDIIFINILLVPRSTVHVKHVQGLYAAKCELGCVALVLRQANQALILPL